MAYTLQESVQSSCCHEPIAVVGYDPDAVGEDGKEPAEIFLTMAHWEDIPVRPLELTRDEALGIAAALFAAASQISLENKVA